MEDDDEKGDGDPEEGRKAAQVMAVAVQRQHVMLVRRRDVYFVHVDRVLQHFHVLTGGKRKGDSLYSNGSAAL